jgi:hypothetical protein
MRGGIGAELRIKEGLDRVGVLFGAYALWERLRWCIYRSMYTV